MFSWIPIIGPFVQGAVNMWGKWQDASVQKAKIGADERTAAGAQDVSVIGIRAGVAQVFAHDVGVVFARDVILNWYAVYVSLIFYDSCFRNLIPAYTWRILAIPTELSYLCTGIVAFLFITAWRGNK